MNSTSEPSSTLSLARRVLVTLGGLVLYRAVSLRLPLPGVDRDAMADFVGAQVGLRNPDLGHISVLALGIAPLLTGFLLVEFGALTLRVGQRLRDGGIEGRRRLNRIAVQVSLAVAAIQAFGIVLWLESLTTAGERIVISGPASRLIACLSLVTGTALAFLLGKAMTTWGLGNGFAVLVMGGMVAPLARFILALPLRDEEGLQALWDPLRTEPSVFGRRLVEMMILAGGAAALVAFMAWRRRAPMEVGGQRIGLALPAFPIGLTPLSWAFSLPRLLWSFGARIWSLGAVGEPYQSHPWVTTVLVGLLTVALSWPVFHLFSSLPRLRSNLTLGPEGPEVRVPEALSAPGSPLGRQAISATAVLAGAGLVATNLVWVWDFQALDLVGGVAGLVMALALGLDLLGEGRFRKAHPAAGRLLEMDNVHLASLLHGRLEEEGIPCLIQGWNFRSLLFFFGPLYKMQLLVPEDDLERARELVRPETLPRV